MNCFTSDHCLIILALDAYAENQIWRRKPFQFEAMWLANPGCNVEGTPMFIATKKLKKCKRMLKA